MKNLFNKIFNSIVLTFFIIMLCLFIFILIKNVNTKQIKKKVYPKHFVKSENKDSISLDLVYNELIRKEVKYPEIVICQVILETGYLKSYSCRVRNNLFGFYNGKQYLSFKDWRQCICYKRMWQNRYYKGGNYYEFLEKLGYSEDSLYVDKLKRIKYGKNN